MFFLQDRVYAITNETVTYIEHGFAGVFGYEFQQCDNILEKISL